MTLVVRILPGQLTGDYQAHAQRLAEGMGAVTARVTPYGRGLVRVTLLNGDPLGTTTELPHRPAGTSALVPILAGVDEHGQAVTVDFRARVHLIIQGHTGSGKSRLSYGLLQQLATAPDAIIAGADPSSVLLRPFQGTRHAPWQTLGANVTGHLALLEGLTAEMDDRLAAIPPRCDELPLTPRHPLIFVVLEEWLAVLSLAGADRKLRDRLICVARRLATESGKVNMRVIMLVQRAEANEMGGGLVRDQFAYRITLPVGCPESVRLLHPTVPLPIAEAHVTHGQPGIALYHAPGCDLGRLRTPWVPDYATYWDAIKTLTAAAGSGTTLESSPR